MKKINVVTWEGTFSDGKKVQESIITVLSFIINTSSEQLPNGMEQFRFLQRISSAFDSAEKTKVLELEDKDYAVLTGLLDKNVPPRWALSKDISSVVEEFMKL